MVIPLILTLCFNKFTCILCITSSLFKFQSAGARLLTMTLQTFSTAGPAWDGSNKEVADEDMTKT